MISNIKSLLTKYRHDNSVIDDIGTPPIYTIPDELLAYIFSWNGNNVNYSMVCKRWKCISINESYRLPLYKALKKKEYLLRKDHKIITFEKTFALKGIGSSIISLNDYRILFANKKSAVILKFDHQMINFYETEIIKQFNPDRYEWKFLEYSLGKFYFSVKEIDEERYSALSIYNSDGSCKHSYLSFREFSDDIDLLSKEDYVAIDEKILLVFSDAAIFKISIDSGVPLLLGILQDHELLKLDCPNRLPLDSSSLDCQYILIKNRLLIQRRSSLYLIDIDDFISIPMTQQEKDQFNASPFKSSPFSYDEKRVMVCRDHPTTFVAHDNKLYALRINDNFSKLLCLNLNKDNHWIETMAQSFSSSLYTPKIFRKFVDNDSFVIINHEDQFSQQPILSISATWPHKPFSTTIVLISKRANDLRSRAIFNKNMWSHPLDRETFKIDRYGYYFIQKMKKGIYSQIEIGHFFHKNRLKISFTEARSIRLIYMNEFILEVVRGRVDEDSQSFKFKMHL